MVNATPRPFFTPWKDPVPIVQEAGWAPGPVGTCAVNLAPHRDSIPGPSSPYRVDIPTTLSGPHVCEKAYQNKVTDFITINYFLTINKDLTCTSEKNDRKFPNQNTGGMKKKISSETHILK